MTIAEQFLISVLKNEDLKSLSKVNSNWFDEDEIPVYKYLIDYYKDSGELPGIKSFAKMFSLDYKDIDSRPSLYFKKLRDRYLFSELAENVPQLLKDSKTKGMLSFKKLRDLVARLGEEIESKKSQDVLYSEGIDERLERYKNRTENQGIDYVSMGHSVLDMLFNGYHKGDLVTFAGRAGSKKSWLLLILVLMLDRILPEDFGEVLFVSNEMGNEELQDRLDCLNFTLPYTDFLKGQLSRAKTRDFKQGLEKLRGLSSRIRIIYNCNTLDELETKIGIYAPSAVFVDGSYLFEPGGDEDWKKIQKITRGLKRIALDRQIPLVNTTQLKRSTGRKKRTSFDAQDDFAFGFSYTQDSDLSCNMWQDDLMMFNQEVGITVAKGRKLPPNTEVTFCCNLNNMVYDFKIEETHESQDTEW